MTAVRLWWRGLQVADRVVVAVSGVVGALGAVAVVLAGWIGLPGDVRAQGAELQAHDTAIAALRRADEALQRSDDQGAARDFYQSCLLEYLVEGERADRTPVQCGNDFAEGRPR